MDSYTKAKLNIMVGDIVKNIQHIEGELLANLIDVALTEEATRKAQKIDFSRKQNKRQ